MWMISLFFFLLSFELELGVGQGKASNMKLRGADLDTL
jgi:hypothetical protein